jgi:hypothetical protein
MSGCEDPQLSAEEIVARTVMADELADIQVLLAIVFKGGVLGNDATYSLLHRPWKDWSKINT